MKAGTSKEFRDCKIFRASPKSQGSSPCSTARQSRINEDYPEQSHGMTHQASHLVSSRDSGQPISICLRKRLKRKNQRIIPFRKVVEAFLSTTKNQANKPLVKKSRHSRRIELQKLTSNIQTEESFKLATQALMNKYYGNKYARHFWKEKPQITKFSGEQLLRIKRYGTAAVKHRYATQVNLLNWDFMNQKKDDPKMNNHCQRPQSHKIMKMTQRQIMKMTERQITEKKNLQNSDEIIQFCPWKHQEQIFDDMALSK